MARRTHDAGGMKRASGILSFMAIAGLVGFQLLQVLMLTTGAAYPDPATGRTEAVIIAAEISRSPTYVNMPQVLAIAGSGAVLIGCIAALMVISAIERFGRGR
jgi:hypothetical protein